MLRNNMWMFSPEDDRDNYGLKAPDVFKFRCRNAVTIGCLLIFKFNVSSYNHLIFLQASDIEIYYIYFEITGNPCNLIGPQQCNLFTNRTILGSKSDLFFSTNENKHVNKTTNQSESKMFLALD